MLLANEGHHSEPCLAQSGPISADAPETGPGVAADVEIINPMMAFALVLTAVSFPIAHEFLSFSTYL